MAEAMFERRGGGDFAPGPVCAGPWDPSAMHGGPPAVLCGRVLADHGAGDQFHLARLTVELVRPVPLRPLHVEVHETRAGRRIQLLDAVVIDPDGVEVLFARAMRIVRADNGVDESRLDRPDPPSFPGPEAGTPFAHGYDRPSGEFYMDAFEMRSVDARSFGPLGPSACWLRLDTEVFAGEPITALDRVLSIADFGNGISNIVDPLTHVYINPDLTVNIHRLPHDEWLVSDAVTHVHAAGNGTATAHISDASGELAVANQSLMVAPRV